MGLPPRLKWERVGESDGGGLGVWLENNSGIVLVHFEKLQWISWIAVTHLPFSCWWWWMDWSKNGHALSRQNMWQTMTDPGGVSAILQWSSTVLFDLVHWNLRIFVWVLLLKCFNRQWTFSHVVHWITQIKQLTKTRYDELNAVDKVAESAFSCVE